MAAKINEMTMTEIVDRAVELGFPQRKAKGEAYFHWNSSRELTDGRKLDEFLWIQVCENIFVELTYGQSGPEEAKWSEAELIAGLVQFDLAKALEEATAELPDPKAWEALAKAEEKTKQESEKEAA